MLIHFSAFFSPLSHWRETKSVTLAKSEVPIDTTKDLMIGPTPVIIINTRDKGFLAFSKVCTHLGCLVKYDKERQLFICPCHAGIFDLEGNVVSGPPPRPLQKFAVRVDGGNIVIGA